MTKETQTKVNEGLKVLKIHDKIINNFLNQKKPHEYILEVYDESEEKYTHALNMLEELNYLIQVTKRASNIIKNILFELID